MKSQDSQDVSQTGSDHIAGEPRQQASSSSGAAEANPSSNPSQPSSSTPITSPPSSSTSIQDHCAHCNKLPSPPSNHNHNNSTKAQEAQEAQEEEDNNSSQPRLKPCAKCQSIAYCSRACQKADFKKHKKNCAVMAQEYAKSANLRMESAAARVPREAKRGGLQKWQFDT